MKQRQFLNFSKRVEIYNFIKTVGKIKDGYWVYDEGWSDQKVAQHKAVNVGNILPIRQELGKLRTFTGAPYSTKLKDLEATIVRHEEHIADLFEKQKELIEKVNELAEKYNKLRLKEHFQA